MDALPHAKHIITKLNRAGFTAYFAGGWVRDFIMQHPSDDIDIATDAPPDKILDLFPHTLLVGLAFAVVIVIVEGHQFEVSTFRKDLHYEGGRRPVGIAFCDAREDALRRDFTINGMFLDPFENRVIDYVGGREDIEKGVIRAIGNPDERFAEDRLRMIRAIRFSARFGFHIDPETEEGILENAPTLLPAVAMERVLQEFNKMAAFPHFDQALIDMQRLNLLPQIFPKLQSLHLNDFRQRLAAFVHFPFAAPTVLYLLELFPEETLEEQLEIFQTLRISGEDLKLIEFLHHLRQACAHSDRAKWAFLYANPNSQICLEVIAARLNEQERQQFLAEHADRRAALAKHSARISQKKTLLHAGLLKTQGIEPGKEMGALLKEGERLAIEHDLEDAEEVLKHLQQSPLWKSK